MNFKQAVKSGFNNYANFKGRAQRSEYWFWILFYLLVVVLGFIIKSIVIAGGISSTSSVTGIFFPLNLIQLALIVPTISVLVRRFHDTDRKGWWWLIMFSPFGSLVIFIWLCSHGTPGTNRFGEDLTKPE